MILTVISVERYFAIIHPIISRKFSSMFLMKIILAVVWALSIAYSMPYLVAYDLKQPTNSTASFCMKTAPFDMEIYTIVNFFCLYAIPLLVMTALYSRIATVLWRSSDPISALARNSSGRNSTECQTPDAVYSGELPLVTTDPSRTQSRENFHSTKGPASIKNGRLDRDLTNSSSFVGDTSADSGPSKYGIGMHINWKFRTLNNSPANYDSVVLATALRRARNTDAKFGPNGCQEERAPEAPSQEMPVRKPGSRFQRYNNGSPLIARRKVIRLLVSIVVCFAVCVLPHHVFWLCQYWSSESSLTYETLLIPPITFFLFYLNSAINPFLYALLSVHFRHALKDIFSSCYPSRLNTRHVSLTSLPGSWKGGSSVKGTRHCVELM